MKIIVGHEHMDLDSLGSLALARQLFPDYTAVRSRLCHPIALNVYNIYKEHLQFISSKELQDEVIEKMIVVDTRSGRRIREVFQTADCSKTAIDIYDHHTDDIMDLPGAVLYEHSNGANTTLLALMLMKQGKLVSPEIATVALTGIYADTGSFGHDNVTCDDLKAAAWLIECGASVPLVKRFLKPPAANELEKITKEALRRTKRHLILGHRINSFYVELPKQISGLSTVVERVFELDSSEAVFGCFGFKRNKQILIVGRSAKRAIDVFSILAPYGGGGHAMSASVTLKKRLGNEITDELISLFREKLAPDLTAADIMDKSLPYINEEWDLYRTSRFLEDVKQSGLPVVNEQGKMVGNISLRNISLARKNEDMKAPVKGYMEADVPICYPFTSVHEVENIFFSQAIGRLPVLDMQGRILGVITRERYLEFLAQTQHKIKA